MSSCLVHFEIYSCWSEVDQRAKNADSGDQDDRLAHADRPKVHRRRPAGEAPWKNFLIFNLLERNLQ